MSNTSRYWKNRPVGSEFACANVSLFRLISSFFVGIKGLDILEIGFGHGADFIECHRRGARIFGLDLNPAYAEALSKKINAPIETYYAGRDTIPFENNFDLIYSRDTLYYLTDDEILFFLNDCRQKLTVSSYLILQFIEKDYVLETNNQSIDRKFNKSFFEDYTELAHFEADNPIRILQPASLKHMANKAKLIFVGSKLQIETFGDDLEKIRVNRYMVFRKNVSQ